MSAKKTTRKVFEAIQARVGNSQRKLLLIILADMAGSKGECWPSHSYLAEAAECDRRTVIRHLNALEKDGFISVQKRTNQGMKTSSKYLILDVTQSHNDVTQSHNRCDTGAPPRCDTESHKPLTLINPSKNPSLRDGDFDRFWPAYPKKVGKDAAAKAWRKLDPNPALTERIINDLFLRVDQGAWLPEKHKQYIPNPATYLNGKRWEDEIVAHADFKAKTDFSAIARDTELFL